MSKAKAKIWLALFCSWGQYIRDKKVRTFILTNMTNMSIWVLSLLYFNNIGFDTSNTPIYLLLFICSLKYLMSTLETYIDFPIPYTLDKELPLSKLEIFQIRVLNKYSWPSEICMVAVIVFHFVKNQYTTVLIPVYIIFLIFSDELYALLSYKYIINAQLIIGALEVIAFTFWPSLFIANYLYVLIFNIFIFLTVFVIKKSYRKSQRNDNIKRSQKLELESVSISLFKQLCLKELLFLFKYKKSTLLAPLVLPVMFIFTDSQPSAPVFYASFFIFELALHYGFNYLGVEKEDLIPILTFSNINHMLIRIKSFFFVSNAFLGASLLMLIHVLVFKTPMNTIISSVPRIIFTCMIFCLLSNWNAISNYPFNTKSAIKKFASGLGVFLVLSIMNELINYTAQLSILFFVSCLLISLIGLYLSFINVDYFSRQLSRQTKPILQYLTKDS